MAKMTKALREKDRAFFRKTCGEKYMKYKILDWDTKTGSLRCVIRSIAPIEK